MAITTFTIINFVIYCTTKILQQCVTNTFETFLWLNRFFKYKGRQLYVKEFSDVGIVDVLQIVIDINGNFKSYDEIPTEYDLIPNNRSFVEYNKLIAAVRHHWQLNSVFDNQNNEFVKNVSESLQTRGKSTKSFYNDLFLKIESLSSKQQTRWNEELNLSRSTED